MRTTLMQHAGGPRKTRAGVKELRTLEALRERQLVFFNRQMRPTSTTPTKLGREVIEALLTLQDADQPGRWQDPPSAAPQP